jgi:NAD(P)-dependent dehydrogenase (short-subunit alcohol dehydrogenase family)
LRLDHQIATNLTGSIQLIRAVLPHLRQQGGGRIVQVSSEGGQMAYPAFRLPLGSTAYIDLTRELARRFAEVEAQRDFAFSADRDAAVPAAIDA